MKIELRSVLKTFKAVRALDHVSLEIPAGGIVAVVGANGAGKTTLLRCLIGIAAPDEGQILYDENLFLRSRLDLRQRIGFLPDFPIFFEEWNLLRHISMVLRLYEKDGTGVEDRVLELLTELDLLPVAEAPLGTLSRGQRYKAALAALLAADVEVMLLDEPFASGMDPLGLNTLKQRVRAAVQRGGSLIYTTQILEVAETFSDSVCVLHKGEARAFGPLAGVLAQEGEAAGSLESLFQQLRQEG